MTHSDNNNSDGSTPPTILLPYQKWIEEAYRQVMVNALNHIAITGLPGNHSFYLTFKTSYLGVDIPNRLKERYPDEMTIVLQHQFWDLTIHNNIFSVGLSFGGIPSILTIPLGAITTFADPEAKLALTFEPLPPPISEIKTFPSEEPKTEEHQQSDDTTSETTPTPTAQPEEEHQVISLDAFRKKQD